MYIRLYDPFKDQEVFVKIDKGLSFIELLSDEVVNEIIGNNASGSYRLANIKDIEK